MGSEMRRVRPEDVPVLAEGLARSFAGNPTYGFLFNDAVLRQDDLRYHFSAVMAAANSGGSSSAAVAVMDCLAGAAWGRQPATLPPGLWPRVTRPQVCGSEQPSLLPPRRRRGLRGHTYWSCSSESPPSTSIEALAPNSSGTSPPRRIA